MKKSVIAIGVAAALASGLGVASKDDHERAKQLRDAGDIVPLEQILQDARSRHSGRVIEVELEHEHGRYVYELEFVGDDGRVHEFVYDAIDGSLLHDKQKRKD